MPDLDGIALPIAPGGARRVYPQELASAMSDALITLYEASDQFLHVSLEDWLERHDVETFFEAHQLIEKMIASSNSEDLEGEAWYDVYNARDAGRLACPLCVSRRLSARLLNDLFRAALELDS